MNGVFDLTLPTPLPEEAIQFLLFLTFQLHLMFVLMMLGTAILGMYYFISAWWGRYDRASEFRWDKIILRKFLPLKALAVILGVAPLLLMQVFYTVPFLTATSLHAPYWLAVIVFLIAALPAFDALGQKMEVHPYLHLTLGLIALVLLFTIPGVFVAIVVTAENPGEWVNMARHGGKFFGVLSLHWAMRYLHVLGAAVVLGAGFHLLFAPETENENRKRLLNWIVGGLCFQILGGFALYLSIPREVTSPTVLLLLAMGIIAALGLFVAIFQSLIRQKVVSPYALAVIIVLIITPMLLARQYLQNETLIPLNRHLQIRAHEYNNELAKYKTVALDSYSAHMNKVVNDGPAIYGRSCAFCHGLEGEGNGVSATELEIPPENLTKIRAAESYLRTVLLQGVDGSGMPSFRFYIKPQIDSLLAYMNTEFKTQAAMATGTPTAHPPTFEWERTCAVCHGSDGRGSVLGKRFKPPVPDFTQFSLTPEYAFEIITHGYPRTMMPGFPQLPETERKQLANMVLSLRHAH